MPARDQGKRSTCMAFAVTSAHEVLIANGGAVTEALSEEFLYWHSKRFDGILYPGSTDPGASPRATGRAIHDEGQPRLEDWPYDESRPDGDFASAPKPTVATSDCHRAQLTASKATVEEIKAHLHAGRAVVVAIWIGYGFHGTLDGNIRMPVQGESLADLHAVVIAGYDDQNGNGCWIIRNSWGTTWGDEGYGYLPYKYIETTGATAWTVDAL